MIVMVGNHSRQLGLELFGGFGRTLDVRFVAVNVLIAARHILPDHKPQLITPVIKPCRLDLNVLSHHIAA